MLATALRCRKALDHLSLSMPPACLPQTSGTRMAYIAKTRLTGACLVKAVAQGREINQKWRRQGKSLNGMLSRVLPPETERCEANRVGA